MINIQDFRCYDKQQIIKLFCIEQSLVLLAFIISFISNSKIWFAYNEFLAGLFLIAIVYVALTSFSYYIVGLYKQYMNMYLQEQYLRAFGASLLLFVILNNFCYIIKSFDLGAQTWLSSIILSYIFILINRTVFSVVTKKQSIKNRTIIFGASNKALQLKNNIENTPNLQCQILGYICKLGERERISREQIINISLNSHNNNELLEYCLKNNIQTIVVAVDDRRNNFPLTHLLECKQHGIVILELMEFYEQELQREELSILDPSWVIYTNKVYLSKKYEINKRAFDLIFSFGLLLLVSPIILSIYCFLKMSYGLKNPAILQRKFIGQFHQKINCFEFNCYNKQNTLSWVGKVIKKIKLENIMLLYNILRGDMSFIGPQLIDVKTDKVLCKNFWYYKQRYAVRPGFVSWGYNTSNYQIISIENDIISLAKEQLQYDLYYINKGNFLLDILILLHKITYIYKEDLVIQPSIIIR